MTVPESSKIASLQHYLRRDKAETKRLFCWKWMRATTKKNVKRKTFLLSLLILASIYHYISFSPASSSSVATTTTTKTSDNNGLFDTPITNLFYTANISVPAVVVPTHLDVKCSRHYYCNVSNCQPVHMIIVSNSTSSSSSSSFSCYNEIQSNFFGTVGELTVHYWGDSLQAQLDCDMRQWAYENKIHSIKVKSEYIQVGCPWYCDDDENEGIKSERTKKKKQKKKGRNKPSLTFLKQYAKYSDVIVFNIGGHYENDDLAKLNFERDMGKYYQLLLPFVLLPNKVLIIRSPSPTHFNTTNGLLFANQTNQYDSLKDQYERNNNQYACVPLPQSPSYIPEIVRHQQVRLKALAERLKNATTTTAASSSSPSVVNYLDVYELSRVRYQEHAHNPGQLDCKHYCQNCGLLRSWNVQIANYVINHRRRETVRTELKA